jgi:hypothetical protein
VTLIGCAAKAGEVGSRADFGVHELDPARLREPTELGTGPRTTSLPRSAAASVPPGPALHACIRLRHPWEWVIKTDPKCIINDYRPPTAQQKEKFLETSQITRNLTAVKNHCFLPLS